jgi:hypothetical protein
MVISCEESQQRKWKAVDRIYRRVYTVSALDSGVERNNVGSLRIDIVDLERKALSCHAFPHGCSFRSDRVCNFTA